MIQDWNLSMMDSLINYLRSQILNSTISLNILYCEGLHKDDCGEKGMSQEDLSLSLGWGHC